MRQVEVSAPWSSTTRAGRGASSRRSSPTTSASEGRQIAAVSPPVRTRGPRRTKGPFRTRVFSPGTDVKIDFSFKHSRVKQYLKEGRACASRPSSTSPPTSGSQPGLSTCRADRQGPPVNDRLLMIERAGQGCAIGRALRADPPPCIQEGQRTGALRFGDQRAMALAGALCLVVHAATGFTNRSLRGHVAGLLGTDYSSSQMSYDLRRLRLNGLIKRTPGTNTYTLTPDGIRVAVFYTKVYARLLRPLLEANQPPAIELRRALATIERVLGDFVTSANWSRRLKLVTKSRERNTKKS